MSKEKRLTGTLSRPNRPVEIMLAGHFDEGTIQSAVRVSNRLEDDVRDWLSRGSIAYRGPLTKHGASHARRRVMIHLRETVDE